MLYSSNTSISTLGIFFVLPCIESYQKVDLRTITLSVPPQEVSSAMKNTKLFQGKILSLVWKFFNRLIFYLSCLGVDQRLCDSFCRRCRLLSCVKRNSLSGQCWKCASFHSTFGPNHSQKYSWNQKFAWNFERSRKHLRFHAGTLYSIKRKIIY